MSNPFQRPSSSFNATESERSRLVHRRDDVDSSGTAHHHTLGTGSTQAAPGNHTHDDLNVPTWANVKHRQFGAVGNGVVDDTAAIQACIDWVEANGGGIVYFPVASPEYKTTATLVVHSSNVRLMGAGVPSAVKYTGAGTAIRFGETLSGTPLIGVGYHDLSIKGTANGAVGLELCGAQRFVIDGNWRIQDFTAVGAIGMQFITQTNNLAAPVSTINGKIYNGDITNCYNGFKSTKGAGVTATYGPSHNNFYGLRVSTFTGIGYDNDWGENNAHYGIDVSTSIDGATSIRINDQVCGFYQSRADSSAGVGNTNIGWDITSKANGFIIDMPTGDGTTTWMRLGDSPYNALVNRIQFGVLVPYGHVDRQSVNYEAGNKRRTYMHTGQDFWIARAWKNNGGSNMASGEIATMDATEGCVVRLNVAAPGPRPLVAVEPVLAGAIGGFAEPGSVLNVSCDTGAVAIGDTLVKSTITNGRAKADNTATNPRDIIGWARTSKAAGANGSVKAYII